MCQLVEDDTYLLHLLRYIHLNPVDAGIVHQPAAYPWSSHRAYTGEAELDWITTERGLALFSTSPDRARANYRAFIDQSLKTRASDGRPPTLSEIAQRVCAKHGVVIDLLRSSARSRALIVARENLLAAALESGSANVDGVAEYLGRHPSALEGLTSKPQPVYKP